MAERCPQGTARPSVICYHVRLPRRRKTAFRAASLQSTPQPGPCPNAGSAHQPRHRRLPVAENGALAAILSASREYQPGRRAHRFRRPPRMRPCGKAATRGARASRPSGKDGKRLPVFAPGQPAVGVGHAVFALVALDELVAQPLEHESAQPLVLKHFSGDEVKRLRHHRGQH